MVTVAFLGDTLLGHLARDLLRERGYDHALDGLAPLLERADLTVINHEGALDETARQIAAIITAEKCRAIRGR